LALEIVLFGEIIYAGHLMLNGINHLEGKPKDYIMFLLTIIIANQMLMMDLIFRAAFEDREREEANEKKLIHFYRKTFINRSSVARVRPQEMESRREPMLSVRV
jgi:Tfp pilus assembly protein PilO